VYNGSVIHSDEVKASLSGRNIGVKRIYVYFSFVILLKGNIFVFMREQTLKSFVIIYQEDEQQHNFICSIQPCKCTYKLKLKF